MTVSILVYPFLTNVHLFYNWAYTIYSILYADFIYSFKNISPVFLQTLQLSWLYINYVSIPLLLDVANFKLQINLL